MKPFSFPSFHAAIQLLLACFNHVKRGSQGMRKGDQALYRFKALPDQRLISPYVLYCKYLVLLKVIPHAMPYSKIETGSGKPSEVGKCIMFITMSPELKRLRQMLCARPTLLIFPIRWSHPHTSLDSSVEHDFTSIASLTPKFLLQCRGIHALSLRESC